MSQAVKQQDDSNLDHYRACFARRSSAERVDWLAPIRRDAFTHFEALGFPSRTLEEWRYTNVAPIARQAFTPAAAAAEVDITSLGLSDFGGPRAVFVDGHHAASLSSDLVDEHFEFQSLTAGSPVSNYATLAHVKDDGFSALNTAFAEDAAIVTLSRGAVMARPLHLVFVSSGSSEATASFPRVLIHAESGSEGLIVQEHISLGSKPALTCAIAEVITEADANLDVVLLQRESDATYHMARQCVRQQRSSTFRLHTLNLGGAILRNDLEVVLEGEGASCTLNGLYVATGDQIVDNHTLVDHAVPHCDSHEFYKGIMAGASRGVFRGRVVVRPDAQQTSAVQQNRNLLLSRGAEVNTKPQLEIYADDVKCNHGSSIGQLDNDALFFLRSRGLDERAARVLLTMGFASQVTQSIPNADVAAWAGSAVTGRLEELFIAGGAQ